MSSFSFIFVAFLVLLSLSCTANSQQKKEIIAYFPQWDVGHQPYYVKHIEEAGSAAKITILNYAFAVVPPKNYILYIESPSSKQS